MAFTTTEGNGARPPHNPSVVGSSPTRPTRRLGPLSVGRNRVTVTVVARFMGTGGRRRLRVLLSIACLAAGAWTAQPATARASAAGAAPVVAVIGDDPGI